MDTKRALVTIVIGGILFSLLGGIAGAMIGIIAPDYYRLMFLRRFVPNFQPMQVGIGLGATQGLAAGVFVSLTVVTVRTWYDFRTRDPATAGPRPIIRADWIVWLMVTPIIVVMCSAIALLIGAIIGNEQIYVHWREDKLERLEDVLADGGFRDLRTGHSSAAQVHLEGYVDGPVAFDSLRKKLVPAFGSRETELILIPVQVRRKPVQE